MMKFTVISTFVDLQDSKHLYTVGDEYPRAGYSPKKERIEELSSGRNLLQKPLIQMVEVPELVVQEIVGTVVEEQAPVVEAVVEEPKKRGRKKKDAD